MNESIKNTVNTNITNQTTANSISPTILGTTINSVIDDIRPYKVYSALLTQSSTNAPVATVLQNTLGGTVVWSYNSFGSYTGTLAGAFTENTIFILPNSKFTNFNSHQVFSADINYDDNSFFLNSATTNFSDVFQNNNILSNHYFEIRVYE